MQHVLFSQLRNFFVKWSLAEGTKLGKVNVIKITLVGC